MKLLIKILIYLLFFLKTSIYAIDANRFLFDNGIVLFHYERHKLPIVKVKVLIKASPLQEPSQKAGLANLVAELLTEGTENRTAEQIAEEIEFIGAELSVSTTRDYTILTLSVLKEHIKEGIELFFDVLLHPSFPSEEIERKKIIIKGILKHAEEDPTYMASKHFRKILYGEDHPYGRVVEGTEKSINSITRDDIIKFYKTYYRPNNSIIAVVGDITDKELKTLFYKYLQTWKKRKIPKIPKYNIPLLNKTKIIVVNRELKQANILFGHIGIKRNNPDYYAISVMNYILGGGGFVSRLMNRIREQMGLVYDVHSLFSTNLLKGVFQINLQTKNSFAKKVIKIIKEELRKIQTDPVTETELSEAKSYLIGSFPRRIDTLNKIADFLLLTEFYHLGMDYDKKYPKYINFVNSKDIIRVAKKYIHTDKYLIVIVGDAVKIGTLK